MSFLPNLIIGNTSQLSYYFPDDYEKVSSRNFCITKINFKKYNRIYFLFAEQRTFSNITESDFDEINVDLTIKILNLVYNICEQVVIYSTSELWNDYDGPISIKMPFKYNYSPYIKSKEKLSNFINLNRKLYPNVIIIYPFNFNSIYRKSGFLFEKIFRSIIKKEKISIGNVNFNRDLIHPSIIVKHSINTQNDLVIGSGVLINVKEFINDLYKHSNLVIDDYVMFDPSNNLKNLRKTYYSEQVFSSYDELISLTIKEIYEN